MPYIWRGDLTAGFLRYKIGGLIFGQGYTKMGLFSKFYGIPNAFAHSAMNSYFYIEH